MIGLVKSSLALQSTTQANDFLFFDGELVIVGDFFSTRDRLLRVDNNFLTVFYRYDLGITVGLKGTTTKKLDCLSL